jgi:SsrA-binding protein
VKKDPSSTHGDHGVLAQNRKARHDYFVLETFEAGLQLLGGEVKSIRAGEVSMAESYVRLESGQLFVYAMHITPYTCATAYVDTNPIRPRRLLMHRREIDRLAGQMAVKGCTLIPLKLYLKSGRIKLEIGLCKGKLAGDKRETIKRRDAERETRRIIAAAVHH